MSLEGGIGCGSAEANIEAGLVKAVQFKQAMLMDNSCNAPGT